MLGKLILAAGGIIALGTGGTMLIKHGTSLFNSSGKIKIWLNSEGKCQFSLPKSRIFVGKSTETTLPSASDIETNNPCLKLADGSLDWSNVEIDKEKMDSNYKITVTNKDKFLAHIKPNISQ